MLGIVGNILKEIITVKFIFHKASYVLGVDLLMSNVEKYNFILLS